MVLALQLRLTCLGCRSLWLDEVATATVLRYGSFTDAIAYATTWTDHTPFHFVLTWAFGFLGTSEAAIRLPYAVAGSLSAVAVLAYGLRIGDRLVGIAGGVLVAVLYFSVYYGQESRPTVIVVLLTTLLMIGAHGIAHDNRRRWWVLLWVTTVLAFYTGYIELTAIATGFGYAGLAKAVELAASLRGPAGVARRRAAIRLGGIVLLAATAGLAMAPWLPHLLEFLGRSDLGFGRVDPGAPASTAAALRLLGDLGFSGPTLVLLALGIGSAIVSMLTGRAHRGALLLAWIAVPIAVYAAKSGAGMVTIPARYFAVAFPAGVLLTALGLADSARLAGWAADRFLRRLARGRKARTSARRLHPGAATTAVAWCLLIAPITATAVATDTASYTNAKGSDYRGGADRIIAAGGERAVVLVVGENPDWLISGLRFYGWARGSQVLVVDGMKLDMATLDSIRTSTSVWGAARLAPGLPAKDPTGPPRELFVDFLLLGPNGDGGLARASQILAWTLPAAPGLSAPIQLLGLVSGSSSLGPEMLPAMGAAVPETGAPLEGRWTMQPGVTQATDGRGFELRPNTGETNLIMSLRLPPATADYLLSFACDSSALQGAMRVYAVLDGPSGQVTLPDGGGYGCSGSPATGVLPIHVADSATSLMLWMRATGLGVGRYFDVSLKVLR
jgi:4-amino-4-deoxy-L-arabinose transferase-like glycosyltransferase